MKLLYLFVTPPVQFQDCPGIEIFFQGKPNAAANVSELTSRASVPIATRIQMLLYTTRTTSIEIQYIFVTLSAQSQDDPDIQKKSQEKLNAATTVPERIQRAPKMIGEIGYDMKTTKK